MSEFDYCLLPNAYCLFRYFANGQKRFFWMTVRFLASGRKVKPMEVYFE